MTNREFFTAVAALENIDPALVEHAQNALVKMDETNAKRKEKAKETDATAKWQWLKLPVKSKKMPQNSTHLCRNIPQSDLKPPTTITTPKECLRKKSLTVSI